MYLPSERNATTKTTYPDSALRLETSAERQPEVGHLPMLTLDERGMILDCNTPFERLFDIEWRDLAWHHITRLFPELSASDFVQAGQVYPILDYLHRCAQLHQTRNRRGVSFSCKLFFAGFVDEGKYRLSLTVIPSGDTESQ
jgi:hypothetical protein